MGHPPPSVHDLYGYNSAMASTTDVNAISFKDFLEKIPPGIKSKVVDLGGKTYIESIGLSKTEISLYCGTSVCGGIRSFRPLSEPTLTPGKTKLEFVTYVCRNCSGTAKVYALQLTLAEDQKSGSVFKFGEDPAFGPPTPARVISLIGPQKELFLKGRRSENQGLGIAAFAYYRRVIEDQKNRIFEEIIKVCERLSVDQPLIDELNAAKTETQFSKAVDSVKHGIPQALLINGYNPLTLLHSALSEGLHAQTDEECLELATSIRVVMADFVDRVAQVLKDEAELTTAVSRLVSKKASTNLNPTNKN
jgi:hypothetical protein